MGNIAYSDTKTIAVPGWEASTILRGNGLIPVADRSYGRIATAICCDLDFPQLIHNVGQSQVNILPVPTYDRQAIGPLRRHMVEFRSIKNGIAMFRITRVGQSSAVDPYGHSFAAMDNQATRDTMMVEQVTTHRVFSLYSIIGDFFAWLCMAGLLVSIGTGIYHRQGKVRRQRSRT